MSTFRVAGVGPLSRVVTRALVLQMVAVVINIGLPDVSTAQTVALPQPQVALRDENGVDLLSFNEYLHEPVLSIGSAQHPLADTIYSGADGDWYQLGPTTFNPPASRLIDSFAPGSISRFIYNPQTKAYSHCGVDGTTFDISPGGVYAIVALGNSSECFNATGSTDQTYLVTQPSGSALVENSAGSAYTYTERDGTTVQYGYYPTEITYPDGRVLTYSYGCSDANCASTVLRSVTRNDGLQLRYTYTTLPTSVGGGLIVSSVTAINNAYEYCDPQAVSCALSMTWPTATMSWTVPTSGTGILLTVKDAMGATTAYTMDAKARTVAIQLPSGANISYVYCDGNCGQYSWEAVFESNNLLYENYVLSVTRDGNTWHYTGAAPEPPLGGGYYNGGQLPIAECLNATYGSTNPVGASKQVVVNNCTSEGGGPPGWDPFIQMTDAQGVQFNGGVLIASKVMPEGNHTAYTWDARGNLTQVMQFSKSGSQQITESANYDVTCTNSFTCNEPHWIKDGNGNETDYTYSPSNGMMETIESPPDANGIRPQTNYTYAQVSAWVLNSSAQFVASTPIWVRSTESYCRTTQGTTDSNTGQVDCAGGTGDKVLKTFYYGPNSGPNNVYLRGISTVAGGVTHITCYGYDRFGNRTSVTTPNAGLSLTSCDQFTGN